MAITKVNSIPSIELEFQKFVFFCFFIVFYSLHEGKPEIVLLVGKMAKMFHAAFITLDNRKT